MGSAMALGSVPVGLSCFAKDNTWTVNSSSRGACLVLRRSFATESPQDPPFSRKRVSGCSVDSSFKGAWFVHKPLSNSTPLGLSRYHKTRLLSPCAINYAAGQSDGPGRLDTDGFISVVIKLWDSFPQPVRSFPWTKAFISFYQLIFELTCAVAKYLCIPVLAVSSLSEMSYCAHERKMALIPVPLLAGFAVAGALTDAAVEFSPDLKEGGFPGHLLLIAIFFLLLKLPGPHYPYWLRLIVPHFANGGLWRTVWSSFMWYNMPPTTLGETVAERETVAEKPSEDMKQ